MLKNDFILRNPLKYLGFDSENVLSEGGFGAVLARAGVGKTALLVQLALYTLFRKKNVLHISLDDPVSKVSLWYKEVFKHITRSHDENEANQFWEAIYPHRFIMTFKVEGFSVPKLAERLSDLKEQNIFSPKMVFVDGFPFDDNLNESLSALKSLATNNSFNVWFTVKTHRDEESGPDDIPARILPVYDLFDVLIQLAPEGKEIYVKTLKGDHLDSGHPKLLLDPATMLIKSKD